MRHSTKESFRFFHFFFFPFEFSIFSSRRRRPFLALDFFFWLWRRVEDFFLLRRGEAALEGTQSVPPPDRGAEVVRSGSRKKLGLFLFLPHDIPLVLPFATLEQCFSETSSWLAWKLFPPFVKFTSAARAPFFWAPPNKRLTSKYQRETHKLFPFIGASGLHYSNRSSLKAPFLLRAPSRVPINMALDVFD